MTTAGIKAEITTTLKQYDDAGLIDDISVSNWIKTAIKELGGNAMIEKEDILKVKHGKVKLPDNFYSLKYALKCDVEGYYSKNEEDKHHLQSSYFYEERLEDIKVFNNQLERVPCLDCESCKRVTHSVYWIERGNKHKTGEIYYNNIKPLKIVKSAKRQQVSPDCPNLKMYHAEDEISVFNYNYIQSNFNEGYIFIRYKGLLEDEEGNIEIPNTHRDKLQEYIKYTCIRRILEDIMFNSDDPNVSNKLGYARQKEAETYQEARSEMFMEGMPGWSKRVALENKRRVSVFENLPG